MQKLRLMKLTDAVLLTWDPSETLVEGSDVDSGTQWTQCDRASGWRGCEHMML